jgi:hypothetical protein
MAKHRTFNADRFLDKLKGNESVLRAFVSIWKERLELEIDSLTIDGFKAWLAKGIGDARDEVLEELYRAYDLCSEQGHDGLFAVAAECGYEADPEQEMPVECLTLKVRAEHEEAFNLAYDRYNLCRAERFSLYQGKSIETITNVIARTRSFREKLSEGFKRHKNTYRVLVRHYAEGATTNCIVYHEKRVKATLVFKQNRKSTKISPTIFRPAQQDFLSYNHKTGQLEIEASNDIEEATLRRAFGECFFDDAEFFDYPGADECLALHMIANVHFRLRCPHGTNAKLVELHFRLDQEEEPFFPLRSRDVLRTLDLNGLRDKLVGDQVGRAVFKIWFDGEKRGKRVEIYGKNRIKFNRATHADEVIQLLRDWGVLLDAEDIAELCSEPFGSSGNAALAAS